jgi:hypothetical protein
MKLFCKLSALALFLFVSAGCAGLDPPDPTELFHDVFGAAPPPGVSSLDGDISCGQDCSLWLRFSSSGDFPSFLTAREFAPADCEKNSRIFGRTETMKQFHPPWNPTLSPSTLCFLKRSPEGGRLWLKVVRFEPSSHLTHAVSASFPLPG